MIDPASAYLVGGRLAEFQSSEMTLYHVFSSIEFKLLYFDLGVGKGDL